MLFAVQWTLVGAHEYPVHDTGVRVFPCRMLSSEMHGLWDTHYKIKETLLIRDLQPSLNENVSSQKLYLFEFACSFFHTPLPHFP